MNKISLKNSIQQHVEHVKLNDEKLDELMRLQESSPNNQAGRFRFSTFTKLVGIAATLIIAIAAGLLISNQQTSIGDKIAIEVSKNHLKLKPLEVNSNQLSDLSNYFTQLDFKLVHTKILSDPNWELIGARYCTIQGNSAAQLRLKNKQTGVIETLYQAPYYETQFNKVPVLEHNQPPLEEYAKGIGVNIWVEKGVLFALTNNSTPN